MLNMFYVGLKPLNYTVEMKYDLLETRTVFLKKIHFINKNTEKAKYLNLTVRIKDFVAL